MSSDLVNFDDIFIKGASAVKLPPQTVSLLKTIISQFNWYPDPEGIYKEIAKEFRPPQSDIIPSVINEDHVQVARYVNEAIINNLSAEIRFSLSQILLSPSMNSIKKSHDFEITFADIWNGSEGCPWHCDAIEGGSFLILVYLTDYDVWPHELGGQLEFGKVTPRLDDDYFIDYAARCDDVISHGIIAPENGTCVVVNNHNQFMTHRCFKLTDPKENRITLTLGFDLKVKTNFSKPSSVIWGHNKKIEEGRFG